MQICTGVFTKISFEIVVASMRMGVSIVYDIYRSYFCSGRTFE
jgi:hypothetical protein